MDIVSRAHRSPIHVIGIIDIYCSFAFVSPINVLQGLFLLFHSIRYFPRIIFIVFHLSALTIIILFSLFFSKSRKYQS